MSPAAKRDSVRWIVVGGSLLLALLFSVLGGQALHERDTLWQLQMTRQGELQRLAQQGSQDSLQEQAQTLADAMAADAWVVELVRQAQVLAAEGKDADDASRGYIRSQLYTRLVPRWRRLQSGHPFLLYVHLAPGAEVLLRVHEPKVFGDRQGAGRPMLRDALDDGRSRSGLSLQPDHLGMRAVAPLQVERGDGMATVGAIEVGLGVLDDLRRLDQELGAGVALLVRHNLLASPDGGESLRGLPTRARRWHLMDASRPEVRRWQEQQLLPDPDSGTTLKLIADRGQTYLLNQIVLPAYPQLQDAGPGRAEALALVWRDVSELYVRHQEEKQWLVGKWLLAWLGAEALLLLLLFATRNGTRALMQRHQQALLGKHQQSEQARQLLTVITQAQAAYIDAQNQYQVFDGLLRRILELSASPFGFIGEVLSDADDAPYLCTYAVCDLARPTADAQDAPPDTTLRDPDSLFGRVLLSGQPLLLDPVPPGLSSGLSTPHQPLQAAAGLPIFSRGQLIGLLGLANRAEGYPHELLEQLHPLLATLGQLIEALRRDRQREHQQWRLQRQQDALRALNEIAALPQHKSQEQLRQALQLGARFYQLPLAIISQIDGEEYRVQVQVSPHGSLQDGQSFVLGDTYCSLTLQSDEVLAIEHMAQSPHAGHPCYQQFALETYIGIAIWVGGRRFGTLNFSAAHVREHPSTRPTASSSACSPAGSAPPSNASARPKPARPCWSA
ncbi:GAF domain-containing protein [Pseudomonas lalucatii]|nr:GAF domain-containing protein [Pseudomonas lalucatii]QVM88710.1 GAF domain-containing protein [Pseudomonas lalucatii]